MRLVETPSHSRNVCEFDGHFILYTSISLLEQRTDIIFSVGKIYKADIDNRLKQKKTKKINDAWQLIAGGILFENQNWR